MQLKFSRFRLYNVFTNKIKKNRRIRSNKYFNLPKRSVTKKFYEIQYENQTRLELKVLKKYIKKKSPKILDLGSLDGRVGFMITDMLNIQPKNIYLTDYNENYVENRIKPNIHKTEDSIIFAKVEDVTSLSFEDSSFDFVIAFGDVFNLIYDKSYGGVISGGSKNIIENFNLALSESIRVLKSNGMLLFSINPAIMENFAEIISKINDFKIKETIKINYLTGRYIIVCQKKKI